MGRAPHIGLHAGHRGRAIELQYEELFFVNAIALVRAQHLHVGASAIELIAARACNTWASGCFESGFHLQGAAHAGWQVIVKVVRPNPVGDPAACSLGDLGVAAVQVGWGFGFGVAKVDGAGIKLDHHLADLGHFALRRHADHLGRLG